MVINEEQISWNVEEFQSKIDLVLQGNPMTSFAIEEARCPAAIINELINLLVSQDSIPEVGLNEVTLIDFDDKCSPLDEEILERLADISTNLEKLTVSKVKWVPAEDKQLLINYIITVL